jgi:hypothetical protein
MALTLTSALSVKQKALADTRNPSTQSLLRTFFSHWAQHRGNGDLTFVPISGLQTADVIAADVPCRVHVVMLRKPAASTVDAWAKASDSATASIADGDFVMKFVGTNGGGQELCAVYPDGQKMAAGVTFGSHTAVAGATKSLVADAPVGFAIVGPF